MRAGWLAGGRDAGRVSSGTDTDTGTGTGTRSRMGHDRKEWGRVRRWDTMMACGEGEGDRGGDRFVVGRRRRRRWA